MTHPPEPIPDLDAHNLDRCPQCAGTVQLGGPDPHADTWLAALAYGWRCDHCRITWTPDGTGGEQT